jgi:hypothetical protein
MYSSLPSCSILYIEAFKIKSSLTSEAVKPFSPFHKIDGLPVPEEEAMS